jgi:hypothetical protein
MRNRPTRPDPANAPDPIVFFGFGVAWVVPFALWFACELTVGSAGLGRLLLGWWFVTGMPAAVIGPVALARSTQKRWSPTRRWLGWVGVLFGWSGPIHAALIVYLYVLNRGAVPV